MMSSTHHSEYLQLQSVYLKTVTDGFVSQEVIERQWQELHYLAEPVFDIALGEFEFFESILKSHDVRIHHFPKHQSTTIDSIYCRDAAIATDYGMILCRMGKSERIYEPKAQKEAYLARRIPVLGEIIAPGTLEGGDVAWLDEKTLAVGHSYRTNSAGISQLKALLEPKGVEVLVVDLPHYKGPDDVFHLMSVLSPVDANLAVVYSPLMPVSFRNELKWRGFELVEVPDAEFESMGCNVLALAPRKCMMVAGNHKTRSALVKAGCEVIEYAGDEISVKGGGGPTCLTRPLLRGR